MSALAQGLRRELGLETATGLVLRLVLVRLQALEQGLVQSSAQEWVLGWRSVSVKASDTDRGNKASELEIGQVTNW